jgi:putative addiction module component (TIGR02574 family)
MGSLGHTAATGLVRTVARASSRHPSFREEAGLATAAVRDYNDRMEPSFDDMTKAERILYVQDLWDRIAADPEPVPLTAAQLTEVRRRLADHDEHPDASVPWEIAREQVRIRR